VGVPDQAGQVIGLQPLEVGQDLARVGVDVLGEEILVDRASGRGVDQQEALGFQADGQASQDLPAPVALGLVGLLLEDLSGPVAGPLGTDVEVEGLVEDGVVVVAAQRGGTAFDHQIEAFLGAGPVPYDVAQAEKLLDPPPLNVGQDDLKGLEVPMDVGNHCEHLGERRYPILTALDTALRSVRRAVGRC